MSQVYKFLTYLIIAFKANHNNVFAYKWSVCVGLKNRTSNIVGLKTIKIYYQIKNNKNSMKFNNVEFLKNSIKFREYKLKKQTINNQVQKNIQKNFKTKES